MSLISWLQLIHQGRGRGCSATRRELPSPSAESGGSIMAQRTRKTFAVRRRSPREVVDRQRRWRACSHSCSRVLGPCRCDRPAARDGALEPAHRVTTGLEAARGDRRDRASSVSERMESRGGRRTSLAGPVMRGPRSKSRASCASATPAPARLGRGSRASSAWASAGTGLGTIIPTRASPRIEALVVAGAGAAVRQRLPSAPVGRKTLPANVAWTGSSYCTGPRQHAVASNFDDVEVGDHRLAHLVGTPCHRCRRA